LSEFKHKNSLADSFTTALSYKALRAFARTDK